MAIERAVIKGLILGVVETRSVFTAQITPSGGDTNHVLWDAYLTSMTAALHPIISNVWTAYAREFFTLTAGHWVPYEEYASVDSGTASGDYLPNVVSMVLLGKAPGLRHVGRKFFGPLAESTATANALAATVIAQAAIALAAYVAPFTGLGGGIIAPGVVDSAFTFHAFTGGIVSSLLGSMRRRKPGVGI